MAEPINGRKVANQITARLSLRKPQRESLDILVELLDQLALEKEPDMSYWLQLIRSHYPTMRAFERAFPSLCFALATGVGKTRLMGAMIAWLFITGRSRHFLILAPNLTIYEKLKKDFTLGDPKYVFAGIPEMAGSPPVVITGDDYEDGRGVRLDYAVPATVTGDLFNGDANLHINIFNIAKISARDNKKGAAKSSVAKVRRLQEYLGESYFQYLANLPDLVVLMDEAHRYYADAGARAIDDLKPVLGLELTATPKTTGAKPRPFGNVVYHYPLSQALKDGYVKIPAVGTRRDFQHGQYSPAELEAIKLEDGIHHHEFVKVELENYARNQGARVVKPFMLVVAQDTSHASEIRRYIQSDDFFGGRYKERVIEVHSNLSGEESDDSMQRLLAVEHDETTEIVIHVNKLKEGWDVTNLYTIVPLRASASEILTEQTIGRGLRLPYGKRTGVVAVDRLCIVAHDRFQEIVDRANQDDSLIHERIYIGSDAESDVPNAKPQQVESASVGIVVAGTGNGSPVETAEVQGRYQVMVKSEQEATIAGIALAAVHEEARTLATSGQLEEVDTQQRLVARVHKVLEAQMPAQAQLEGMEPQTAHDPLAVEELVRQVTARVVALTIDVPRIAVLPTREVNYQFEDFDLQGLDKIRFEPVSQEMHLHHLENNQSASIHWNQQGGREIRQENYLVRHLFARDEVDYDRYAGLLYTLAGQMLQHLRSYLPTPEAVDNVVLNWQKQLSDFIWAQMREHLTVTPTDYQGHVTQGFDVLKPAVYSLPAGEKPRCFRTPVTDKRAVRQMVFEGFQRCCYPYQKFDSVDGEWRLAQLLEDDSQVIKWMKPAPGQFRIEYLNGQNYEPDFVVETQSGYLIIEPKQADKVSLAETQAKARAAERWCGFANQHARSYGYKQWSYLLVPDDQIVLGTSIAGLKARFASS
ncbi:DEAD/DEAH box helicase family protein [Pseudomonas solani]|uniref:DEAD/DEAH box helicase family protein n=1 Tax=Pseudomonas solani TaxID=2731552 RepID=A0AAU7Y611_9PSED